MPRESKKRVSKRRQHNVALGQAGEKRAQNFLRALGWEIVATNVTFGQDEIDVVAVDWAHQELVFVEVKTRSGDFAGDPAEAIDERKLAAMIRAAQKYVQAYLVEMDYRFDAIAVLPERIEHFQNITWL